MSVAFKIWCLSFPFLLTLVYTDISAQSIVINEISSANHTNIHDEDGSFEDWIELYNAGNEKVNLAGWGLSDRLGNPYKWIFPEVIIEPGAYLLVWASGKDRRPSPGDRKAGIQRQVYNNIPGNSVADLLNSSDFPNNPTSVNLITNFFEAPTNIADNYGQRMHGLLLAPFTGSYIFWIASDDNGHLLLSTDENPANAVKIAEVPEWTNPREWHKFPQQRSNPVYLEEGKYYYISALMKEAIGGDNLAVRWRLPNNSMEEPIPASRIFWQKPELHTNFSIKSSGEPIILSDNKGNTVDQVDPVAIPSDISYGRFPNAANEWVFFYKPTPGSQNLNHIFPGYSEKPIFSLNGGFYPQAISVSIYSPTPESIVYYSLDGSDPNESYYLYDQPIEINQTTVLRARAFSSKLHPGDISTATYLINEDISMSVVSVTTDPLNLYDDEYGIFVLTHPHQQSNLFQRGMDWERPANFELFERDGSSAINMDVGLRVHGGLTRVFPLKSLAIMARSRYGNDRMNYRVFPDKNIDSYKNLVLRNSGNDVHNSLFRDSFMQHLLKGQMDLELSGYRPSVIFLNGEYWGIRNVREKLNEHFLASNANADPDKVDMLEFTASNAVVGVINGSATDYINLTDYIRNNDLSNPEHYNYVRNHIDISNFIQYNVAQIYFDNTDWPGNNMKWWRTSDPIGKWRWIMFDTDFGFGLMYEFGQESGKDFYRNNSLAMAMADNGPIWPNPPHSTFLLRNLLKNDEFRTEFINTFCDHLNTTFKPDRVSPILQEFKTTYEPEIERLANTFPMNYHLIDHESDWYNSISILSEFATHRAANVFLHLMSQFNLLQRKKLTLDVSDKEMGRIRVNSINCDEYPWSGHYFPDVPVKLTAKALSGYRFIEWSDGNTVAERTIDVASVTTLTARFEICNFDPASIIINEIKYTSASGTDSEDWVELYNSSQLRADLSNWSFKDDSSHPALIFPENTWIEPGGFLIICRDSVRFKNVHPNIRPLIGNMMFGLSSGGETIRLYDSNNQLVNSIKYQASGVWPDLSLSKGSSIELVNPAFDNTEAQNWKASIPEGGTPGEHNSVLQQLTIDAPGDTNPIVQLSFPNPFHDFTTIRLSVNKASKISLHIVNSSGLMVRQLADKMHHPGEYNYQWDATGQQGQKLPAGLYLLRIITEDDCIYNKLIHSPR